FPKDEKQASGTTLIHSQPSQVGQQPWLKIQSARWLNFESAPTLIVELSSAKVAFHRKSQGRS
ncbi:MAG: hypothetical protein ACOZE7_13195, partial [Pseudomonadota bacterium]